MLACGVLTLSSCVPSWGQSKATPLPPIQLPDGVIAVGARDLFDLYQSDEGEADKLFKGKTLEVTGPVSWARSVLGDYYIVFGSSSFMTAWGIQCAMKDKTDPRLSKIKKGNVVKVRGRCEGFKMDVIMKECVLVE